MLEPCRVRKNIFYFILSIPRPSDALIYFRGFSEIFFRTFTLKKLILIQLLHVIDFVYNKKKNIFEWGLRPQKMDHPSLRFASGTFSNVFLRMQKKLDGRKI